MCLFCWQLLADYSTCLTADWLHICVCMYMYIFDVDVWFQPLQDSNINLFVNFYFYVAGHDLFYFGVFILQISRSIGDVYLKKPEFNREPLYAKFRLREPFKRPILSSEPSISEHELQPDDQFLIFASDGLWEHLSNQEAVDIVKSHPHHVSCLSSPHILVTILFGSVRVYIYYML